ncbi:MAG: hypothetical protein ACM3SW_14205 [Actinomycetota bacterium]
MATGHPIIARFEPGENWFFDYEKRGMVKCGELSPPHSHAEDQPVPERREEFRVIGNHCCTSRHRSSQIRASARFH